MVIFPEWIPLTIGLHAVLGAYAVVIGPLSSAGLLKMNYSKFRTGEGISSRVGMFILYFVPIVVLGISAFAFGVLPGATTVQLLLLGAVAVHFTKRCLEVFFVHVYSGPIDRVTVAMVTFNYSLLTLLVGMFVQTTPELDTLFWVGVALFVVGELANGFHHLLLARLRREREGYFTPVGGLFGLVSAPHFLCEIVAWLGFAFMGRHLIFYIALLIMTHYLFNRAARVHAWYRARFADYPSTRRRILPFVY
jgi:hypothetical protein